MDAHTVIEEWEVSPFDGGFDGLRDLQSRRFSGVVEAGDSRLFLREGDPLAVVSNFEEAPREGSIDAFEGASGRLHEAPHPGTVSLAAMLALDGEVRGRYFSDDTPLSEVHETLSGGGFTGYVELAENVLSGDYYMVYEDGDVDYLGYISSSGRLLTGEEAQEKAEGEIGIYDVVAVSLPDIEIPVPSEPEPEPAAAGAVSESDPEPTTEPASEPEPESDPQSAASAADAEATTEPEPTPEPDGEPEPTPEPAAESEGAGEATPAAESASESEASVDSEEPAETTAESPAVEGPSEAAAVTEPEAEPTTTEPSNPAGNDRMETPSAESSAEAGGEEPSESSSWDSPADSTESVESTPAGSVMDGVTARSVPSVDPENTGRGQDGGAEAAAAGAGAGAAAANTAQSPAAERRPEPDPEPTTESAEPTTESTESTESTEPEVDVEARIDEVREEYEAELESLRAELDSLRAERDRLRDRVETLEAAEAGTGGAGGAGPSGISLTPDRAFGGTSLFVRDEGPGGPTLEDAHAGDATPEELAENLRIEYHTQFDDEGATVDGEPFDSFLRSSPLYSFTEWLLTDLLFEIRSTGSMGPMRPLYDALPDIDRVSFDDTITVGEGDDQRTIEFDVVARDRMGEPLVVANMDESREPTHAASLEPLIDDASDVVMEAERLAGAFAVTSSYFEPDALEAAREATSGSLLSREKRRNFVKLSRKKGFHLCLVESRDESFHMTMPEL